MKFSVEYLITKIFDSYSPCVLCCVVLCVLCTDLGQQPDSKAIVTEHYLSNSVLSYFGNILEIYCWPL